jgi:hypothetical protein
LRPSKIVWADLPTAMMVRVKLKHALNAIKMTVFVLKIASFFFSAGFLCQPSFMCSYNVNFRCRLRFRGWFIVA